MLKDILISCGHIAQNLYLACESIGAGTCAILSYDQDKLEPVPRHRWDRRDGPLHCAGRQSRQHLKNLWKERVRQVGNRIPSVNARRDGPTIESEGTETMVDLPGEALGLRAAPQTSRAVVVQIDPPKRHRCAWRNVLLEDQAGAMTA